MEIYGPAATLIEVYVDPHLCRFCGICIEMCSMGVFAKNGKTAYPIKSHLCCSCFKCNEFCPHHAITMRWIVRG